MDLVASLPEALLDTFEAFEEVDGVGDDRTSNGGDELADDAPNSPVDERASFAMHQRLVDPVIEQSGKKRGCIKKREGVR